MQQCKRFGFNGKENDNEVKGEGGQQDYGMRIYDSRLGRFLSVDPLTKNFPWYTPYQFAGNSPIAFVDLDGAEPLWFIKLLDLFGLSLALKQQHSDDIEKEAEYQQVTIQRREATKKVAEDVKKGYEAQKVTFSILPGAASIYAIMEGKTAVAVGELAIEIFGGRVVEGLVKGIRGVVSNFRRVSGSAANADFIRKGWDAAYDQYKEIVEFTTTQEQEFVRVYSSEKGNFAGSFMMEASEIEGLTPQQIQNKFSLDYIPDMRVTVTVPTGTEMRAGTAAARKSVRSEGGDVQFQSLDRLDKSAFKNKTRIQ